MGGENGNILSGSTAIAAKLCLWDDQGEELVNLPYSRANRALRVQPVAHSPRAWGSLVQLNPSTSLKVKLGGAPAATQCSIMVSWVDENQNESVDGQTLSTTNSTTDVTAAAAPAAGYMRGVKAIVVCNRDSAAVAVSIMVDNGTQYYLGDAMALASKSTLILTREGSTIIPQEGLSAAALLAAILTVDGAGSGLDADLLDGLSSTAFLKVSNNLSDLNNAGTARTNLGLSANGSSLVTAADYAAMRALLDLEAGTDFYSIAAANAAFAALSHVHAAGDITSGVLAVARGGAGAGSGLTGGAGSNLALDITGLTADDPALTDEVPVCKAGTNKKVTVEEVLGLNNNVVQGRLTLTTATPVTSTDVTAAATVYFALYGGQNIALYDGTRFKLYAISELSNVLADTSTNKAGPAAVVTDKNYDLFVWDDSGTVRLTRGPKWDDGAGAGSATARGTGAASTELELYQGVWVNKVAITNGPGARLGRYVGTIRGTGSSTTEDSLSKRFVWNMYNRKPRKMIALPSTNFASSTSNIWEGYLVEDTHKIYWVRGLDEDQVRVRAWGIGYRNTGHFMSVGVGIDSNSANSAQILNAIKADLSAGTDHVPTMQALYEGYPGLGYHYAQMLQFAPSDGGGTSTFFGDGGLTRVQAGMEGEVLT